MRKEIGPIASPDLIQFAPGLPKTRSGKIMRRILRKIAEDDFSNLGDTSTLADPSVVDDLVENRQNREIDLSAVQGGERAACHDLRKVLIGSGVVLALLVVLVVLAGNWGIWRTESDCRDELRHLTW